MTPAVTAAITASKDKHIFLEIIELLPYIGGEGGIRTLAPGYPDLQV